MGCKNLLPVTSALHCTKYALDVRLQIPRACSHRSRKDHIFENRESGDQALAPCPGKIAEFRLPGAIVTALSRLQSEVRFMQQADSSFFRK